VKKIVILVVVVAAALSLRLTYPSYKEWKQNRFLAQANAFLVQGDLRNAAFSARKTLEVNQRNIPACRIMAQVAEQIKSPQAFAWRSRVVELEPGPATNRFELARAAMLVGNYGQALNALNRIKEADRNQADYHTLSAMLAAAQNNPDSAEAHCLEAVRLDPKNKFARFNLAVMQVQSKDAKVVDEAIRELDQLRADPEHRRDALRNLVSAVMRRNEFARAQGYSQQLLEEKPVAFEDRLLRLFILKTTGSAELPAYLASLESVALPEPRDFNALVTWLRGHQMTDEALRWLTNLPPKQRADRLTTELTAHCCEDKGDWATVQELLEDKKWGDMDFVRLGMLAHALQLEGEKYTAQANWQAAVNAASRRLPAMHLLLNMANTWGWAREREDLAWRIVEGYPSERGVLALLERYYAATGDSPGLQKVYAKMMKYEAPDAVAKNNFAAVSLLLNRQLSEAREIARENYTSHPEDGVIVSTYAFALHLQGKTGEGIKLLQKLKPEELQKPAVATYYGVLLAAAGQMEKAKSYLDIAARSPQLLPEEKKLIAGARETAN